MKELGDPRIACLQDMPDSRLKPLIQFFQSKKIKQSYKYHNKIWEIQEGKTVSNK